MLAFAQSTRTFSPERNVRLAAHLFHLGALRSTHNIPVQV